MKGCPISERHVLRKARSQKRAGMLLLCSQLIVLPQISVNYYMRQKSWVENVKREKTSNC